MKTALPLAPELWGMRTSASSYLLMSASPLATEQSRQRLVKAVIAFTEGTALFPQAYEQQLLDQFVRGRLTIDEVVYYLEAQASYGC